MEKEISGALFKKATGFSAEEITEEYAEVEGELQLTKKKITTKYFPPDVSAAKALSELNPEIPYEALTDEELEREKERLFKELEIAKNASLAGDGANNRSKKKSSAKGEKNKLTTGSNS